MAGLKLEVTPPPPVSAKTLALGSRAAPESACMPMKINLGNYIEALELGADTIVMAGGWGPCRFGWFAQSQADILRGLGYEFDMLVLEKPADGWRGLPERLRPLGVNTGWRERLSALRAAWRQLLAVEQLEAYRDHYLPRALDKDAALAVYRRRLQELAALREPPQLAAVLAAAEQEFKALPQHRRPVPLVGLVGEIYTILEPSANYHVAEELGRLGAECVCCARLTDWVNDHVLGGRAKASERREILRLARPYIAAGVGGRGQETVGEAALFARRRADGVIQLGPLGCMPELVAQSVLPELGRQENIPVMTLWVDEHSGSGGLQTRLEAFCDLLRRRAGDNKV